LGDCRFIELNSDKILKLYISIRDSGKSRATVHKAHTLFCLLADLFCELRPDAENAPRKVNFGKFFPKRAPKREINFLTPEELEKIYKVAVRSPQRLLLPLIRFLANTGMRRSEALNLKWTDIDRENGFFHVRMSKTGRARIIPIEPEAAEAIRYLEGRGEYVFTYPNGSRPDVASFRRPLVRAAKKAGIQKRIDLHTLRHSYGSNKIRAGWGLKKVSMLLGHSDISMTANIYTHLLDGDLRLPDHQARVFDKADRSIDSEEAQQRREISAQVLATILENAFKDKAFGNEALQSIENEMERILRSLPGMASDGLKRTGTASDGTRQPEIPGEHENGQFAPQVLRKDSSSENVKQGKELGSSDFLRLFGMLGQELNGRGNWIRTSDLFVPNEAR
jgi:integrase